MGMGECQLYVHTFKDDTGNTPYCIEGYVLIVKSYFNCAKLQLLGMGFTISRTFASRIFFNSMHIRRTFFVLVENDPWIETPLDVALL